MGAKDITYFSLALLGLFILPIMYMNYRFKIKINKRILYAITRMTIQLTLVGLYLQYIFKWNHIVVNILYIILMMLVASLSIIKSVKLPYKKMLLPIFVAIFIPSMTILIYFNYFVVKADFLFDATYLITIGGMILGNVLNGIIVGMNSFYNGIVSQEKVYLYNLALGASKNQAKAPYFREAVYATINPTIASIATIGLISLPGMMTGQILGGSDPFVAIKYQIAIMLAIFIVKYFTIVLALWFCSNTMFDGFGRLQVQRKV